MKKHTSHTTKAMKEISIVARVVKDHKARWYKVNWIIVQTSHEISTQHGASGHRLRQKIRHRLWRVAQQRHQSLKIYSIPKDIAGDSDCKIIWYYRILIFFRIL